MAEDDELGIVHIYGAPFTKKGRKDPQWPQFVNLRPSFDAMEDDGTAQDNATNKTIHEVSNNHSWSL